MAPPRMPPTARAAPLPLVKHSPARPLDRFRLPDVPTRQKRACPSGTRRGARFPLHKCSHTRTARPNARATHCGGLCAACSRRGHFAPGGAPPLRLPARCASRSSLLRRESLRGRAPWRGVVLVAEVARRERLLHVRAIGVYGAQHEVAEGVDCPRPRCAGPRSCVSRPERASSTKQCGHEWSVSISAGAESVPSYSSGTTSTFHPPSDTS